MYLIIGIDMNTWLSTLMRLHASQSGLTIVGHVAKKNRPCDDYREFFIYVAKVFFLKPENKANLSSSNRFLITAT